MTELQWAAGLEGVFTNLFCKSLEGSLDLEILLKDMYLRLEMQASLSSFILLMPKRKLLSVFVLIIYLSSQSGEDSYKNG